MLLFINFLVCPTGSRLAWVRAATPVLLIGNILKGYITKGYILKGYIAKGYIIKG